MITHAKETPTFPAIHTRGYTPGSLEMGRYTGILGKFPSLNRRSLFWPKNEPWDDSPNLPMLNTKSWCFFGRWARSTNDFARKPSKPSHVYIFFLWCVCTYVHIFIHIYIYINVILKMCQCMFIKKRHCSTMLILSTYCSPENTGKSRGPGFCVSKNRVHIGPEDPEVFERLW